MAQSSSSPLLNLPREIRDTIWELAVTEDSSIHISSQLSEPGLLQANKQIRHEARELWFSRNQWRICITDNNTRVLRAFLARKARVHAWFAICFHRSTNWANLVEHMRAVWADRDDHLYDTYLDMCADTPVCSAANKEHRAVWRFAMKMAREMRGHTWQRCEAMLADLREMTCTFDPTWAADQN